MGTLKVPVLGRRVQPSALPAAQVSVATTAADFGGLEAELISQVGRGVERVGEIAQRREAKAAKEKAAFETKLAKAQKEFNERRDKTFAREATNGARDWWRNQKQTYLGTRGTSADGITTVANKDIESFTKELLSRAKNDRQRELIRADMGVLRESWMNTTHGHQVSEFLKNEIAVNDNLINNTIRDARELHDDPIGLLTELEFLEDALKVKTINMRPAQAKSVKAEAVSAFREAVLNEKVMADATEAQEYYNKNKKSIVPENREAIENILNKEDVLQFAQKKTDEISIRERDRTKWAEMARKETDDPKKREALVKSVKVRKDELDQLDNEAREETKLEAFDKIINRAKNLEEGLSFAIRLENPEDQIAAEKIARARFEEKKKARVTDKNKYAEAWEAFNDGSLTTVRQLNEFWPDLSDTHYNKIQSAIQSKTAKDKGAKIPEVTWNTVKGAYQRITNETYDVTNQKMNTDMQFLMDRLEQHARDKGDDLTPAESDKLAARYIVEGEVIGGSFLGLADTDLSLAQAVKQGKEAKWLPDVNDDDIDEGKERQDIIAAYAKKGILTENETLLRLYKKQVTMGRPLSPEQIDILNSLIRQETRK